ncbi:MAG: LysR family transcriptional regulator, partial [Lactobacillus apis]|nr:LysR family transcriptional regulator [Lactobacillus apis]
MNFTQLNTFITVVETGSFQKAAATQYISQRAVSQSIAKLENELGFKLFERGKNKISITSQGQEFFLKTKEILHSFSVEINSLRHEAATTYQELKVGYFSPFEGALLLQKIFDANQKQPELKIKITEESIEH